MDINLVHLVIIHSCLFGISFIIEKVKMIIVTQVGIFKGVC